MSAADTAGGGRLSHCAAEVRAQDHDRWLTLLHAAPGDREALAALYAFHLEIARTRETVSEPMIGEIRLQWWRETVEGLYRGEVRRHPVAEALAGVAVERGLPEAELQALIDARAADLHDEGPKSFDDLLAYADATGGMLSRLAARVCGVAGEDGLAAADSVGRAWALTGLLRALGFLAAMRRTPLPEDALREAGIARETLFAGEFPPELRPLAARMAGEARTAIALARQRAGALPRRALSPLLLATLAEDHLARLARADHDPLATDFSRGALPRLWKLWRAARRGRF